MSKNWPKWLAVVVTVGGVSLLLAFSMRHNTDAKASRKTWRRGLLMRVIASSFGIAVCIRK